MTIKMFIGLITVLSPVTSTITEIVKKNLDAEGVNYSSNLIAFIIALILGIGDTAICYWNYGVEITLSNVACVPLVGLIVWVGSMIGYDKAVQMIEQISKIRGDE